jgi:predicted transport protein
MILFQNGQKYKKYKYRSEDEFETEVVKNSKLFFGTNIVYIEAKKKIESKALGGSIPDAFLFDLSDKENPNFYLVEIELADHDFYKHVFPQITKFFAFFKNDKNRTELVEKIFSLINTNQDLKQEFRTFLGEKEIYKFVKDVIEDSQNILLVIDNDKKELPEIMETYSDTWGKMVKLLILRKFIDNKETIFTLEPEFENIEYVTEGMASGRGEPRQYSEEFHLDGIADGIKQAYFKIKEVLLRYNKKLIFNPQKYYISIVHKKNVAFFTFRKKTFRIVIALSEKEIKKRIHKHKINSLSESVQKYYGYPCAEVIVENEKNISEIIGLLKSVVST